MKRVNLFIRSLIFSISSTVTAILWSILCVIAYALCLPLRFRYKLVAAWTDMMIWTLRVVCCIDYKLEGLENIPKNRNGIVFCKHQSAWETFFLPGYFYELAIILKKELYWMPFFGWGLATIEPIAINRKQGSSAMEQIIKKGRDYLAAGRWILVFPEGTRVSPGTTGKYHLGGARLAAATGYPVLPIAHNAGLYWPRRKFIKKPGTVHIVVGPLIESQNRSAEEILHEAKTWIEETMKKL